MTITIDSVVKEKMINELKERKIKYSHFIEAKVIKAMKEGNYALI